MTALRQDPRFLLPEHRRGPRGSCSRGTARSSTTWLRACREYFRTIPPGKLAVERVPASAEKGSAGAYYNPAAMDGSRPGTFFANLRDTAETPTWGMKTLAYHEGIPGHHFQIATAQGLKGLPLIRQQPIYTAYAEGWALYAERLAAEIGLYKDDPFGDLGRLQAEMFRAVRLVVDTGLHAKGWTREQAIDYMVRHDRHGRERSRPRRSSATWRCRARPAPTRSASSRSWNCATRRAPRSGEGSTSKDFHAVVLENGAVPLTVLERLVDEWLAGAGQPTAAPRPRTAARSATAPAGRRRAPRPRRTAARPAAASSPRCCAARLSDSPCSDQPLSGLRRSSSR